MKDETREHISSLMDGEQSRETGLFLARRLGSDGELQQVWARYHLIRDCLRHRGNGLVGSTLGQRLEQALSDEQPPAKSAVVSGWFKPVAGMAIAASVALMAVVTLNNEQVPGVESVPDQLAGASDVTQFVSPNTRQSPLVSGYTQAVSFAPGQPTTNSRMNSYLLRHNQMAGAAGRSGFVSFVPIVSERIKEERLEEPEAAQDGNGVQPVNQP